jgi:SIR2-like domain
MLTEAMNAGEKAAPEDISPLRQAPFAEAFDAAEKLIGNSSRAFLVGAGCSKCAGLPLTCELKDEILGRLTEGARSTLTSVMNSFKGASSSTIEEYISEIVDVMAIAKRRKESGAKETSVELDKKIYSEENLSDALKEIRASIVSCIKKNCDISVHRRFVRAVHYQLRSGRRDRSRPADYLVLNYDTLIEDALGLESVPFSDGMAGGTTGWWDLGALGNTDLQARTLKLHGSIDWVVLKGEVLPRRIRESIAPEDVDLAEGAVIWPSAAKYRETERDPFAQLAKMMRQILRPGARQFTVLTICGYRFGDAHINLELYRALKESEQRLTVLVFTEMDKPDGIVRSWHEDPQLRDQVRIYARKGFFHTTDTESAVDLPWWKFEVLTRLLEGER